MSVFWTYFKDTLKFNLLHGRGAIVVLVKGASEVLDTARDAIRWFRDQMNPAACDAAYLPLWAKSRGLRVFAGESDGNLRKRVCSAYTWHSMGGKTAGLKTILAICGYDADVINMRAEDEERWAEFVVAVNADERSITADDYDLLPDLINDSKAASAKLAGLRICRKIESRFYQVTVPAIKVKMTIGPYVAAATAGPLEIYQSSTMVIATRISIGVEG